ncbi:MAG: trigger factor [Phytoplasma sp.]|uniref:trigger factor n=1 Tax=Phytoplasma sp. TaxID=2155 RepID=UPI002B408402|nr:trigger factor [Phytoplasma sp.]WRH06748.1 MAG: trigger factor [Phytoplasma sp.]
MEVKKINNDFVQYHFQIKKNEFDILVDKVFEKIKPKVEVKGFRKGFVTRSVFEKHFDSQSLYKDAFETLVQLKFKEILDKNKEYNFIGQPKLINFQLEKLNNIKNVFDFGLELMLKPKLELCNYQEIPLNKYNSEVTEEEVQKKIDALLYNHPILEKKENDLPLELGDFAVFDFQGYLNNQLFEGGSATNYTLEIGSNQFIPGFEKEMIGLKINKKKDITLSFPNDYANTELAGKEVCFKVWLKDIKRRKNVFLNDEIVKNFQIPDIYNVQEFKTKIKEELIIQKKYEAEHNRKEDILDFICKNSVLNIPQFLIDEETQNLKKELEENLKSQKITLEQYLKQMNFSEEKFNKDIQEKAFKTIKINLLLDEIGSKENINISQEELDESYKQINKSYKIDIQVIKENPSFVNHIKDDLIRRKTIDLLLNKNNS